MHISLEQVIQPDPLTISPNTPVNVAIALMSQHASSYVLIEENQQVQGIFTERDLVRWITSGQNIQARAIADVMTQNIITYQTTEQDDIFSIFKRMRRHRIRHLPVISPTHTLRGIITLPSIQDALRPEHLLRFRCVTEVMISTVVCAAPSATLNHVTQLMSNNRVSCAVIVKAQDNVLTHVPIGIITEHDIVQFQVNGIDFSHTVAESVMSTPLATIQTDETLWAVHEKMQRLKVRRLVVADDQGTLSGIVTQSDILRILDPAELYGMIETMQRSLYERTAELAQEKEQRQETERKQQDTEERLALALELSSTGSWELNLTSGYVIWNDSHFRLMGLEPGETEASYELWVRHIHPDDVQRVIHAFSETIETDKDCGIDYRIIYPNGSIRWIMSRGRAVHNAADQTTKIIGISLDITDRKRTEEALKHSEAQNRAVLNAIPDLLLLYKSDGTFQEVIRQSNSLDSLIDQVPDEINPVGQHVSQFLPLDIVEQQLNAIQAAIVTGHVQSYEQEVSVNNQIQHEDIRVSPLNDETVLIMVRDIGERKRHEHILCQYKRIVNATTDGVVLIDQNYRYQIANQTYLDWHQKRPAELIHQSVSHIVGHELFDRVLKPKLDQCLQGEIQQFEIWVDFPSVPQKRYLGVNYDPYRERNGTIGGVVAVFRDLTELKRTTEALQDSETRNRAIVDTLPDLLIWANRNGDINHFVLPKGVNAHLYMQPPKNVSEILSEETCATELHAIQQAIDTNTLQIHEINLEKYGQPMYEEIRVARINEEEALIIIRDITERKHIEHERQRAKDDLNAQKNFLQNVIDAIPSSVFVKNSDGYFILANRAAADVYGVAPDDIIGLRDCDLNPDSNQVESFLERNWKVIDTCQTWVSDDQHIAHPQKGSRWYQTSVSPWIDSNKTISGVIGNCVDITERKRLELALQDSESQLQDILSSVGASIGYFRLHPDGRWDTLYQSQGCVDVFGYTHNNFFAEDWLANVQPEDANAVLYPALESIRQGDPTSIEYRFRRPDGSLRWISDALTSRWDADQQCWLVTAIGTDVSDRKRIEIERHVIEDALRRENQFRSQIIDQMAEGLCVCYEVPDYPYVRFSVWNQHMTTITGYSQEGINKHGWHQSLYPDPKIQAHAIKRMKQMRQGYDFSHDEWDITRSDGKLRTVSISTTLLSDGTGAPLLLMVIQDVSDRKEAEAEILRQRNFLHQVINAIPNSVFVKDSVGQYMLANTAAAALHGQPAEGLLGKSDADFYIDQAQVMRFHEENRRVMESLQTHTNPDEYILNYRGEGHWYQTTISPFITMAGEIHGVIGTSINISDRKQAEQNLQASLREKDVLLSEVHHRVKNNLQVIMSLLNLQALRVHDPIARQTLEQSSDRVYAMSLVHEKLYRTQHFEGIILSEYIREFVDHLVHSYEDLDNPIHVEYRLNESIDLPLAQAMQFSLILNELVTNALKHGDSSQDGQQRLYIELSQPMTDNVLLKVGNNGQPLPDDFSLTMPRPSMGLQLVQVLTEQLNGEVQVDSGEIIWFALQFPVTRSSSNEP